MPRRMIIGGVALAIAAAIVIVIVMMRGGSDDERARGENARGAVVATNRGSNATSNDGDDTQPRRLREVSRVTPLGSNVAPVPPPEAEHDVMEAFTMRRFDDVRELCASRELATAHAYECTIAACKTHSGIQARSYYVGVSDADRAKVEAECAAENVTFERPERPHPVRPHRVLHGRKGAVVEPDN